MNGGIPAGISANLLLQINAEAFQHMFSIGIVFAVLAFIACWFLRKELLATKEDAPFTPEPVRTESTLS